MRNLTVILMAVAAASSASCSQAVECGEGTMERDGVCVAFDECPGLAANACGDFTFLDPIAGSCAPEYPPTICNPTTTTAVVGADGITECFGEAPTACTPLACPSPDPGRVTFCGQLVDVENNRPISNGDLPVACTGPADGGPCALAIRVYDALEFATDPDTAPELAYDELYVNQCGAFRIVNIAAPGTGYLGIGVDDSDAVDDYVLSGVAVAAAAGARLSGEDLYAVRASTDGNWTGTAGNPFAGETFSQRGAYLPIFLRDGQPVAGVTVTENGAAQPAQDYYFSDTDPDTRMTVDPGLSATGANGSALLIGSSLVNHSGTGGLPVNCNWPSNLAATIPSVVFVQERHATGPGC